MRFFKGIHENLLVFSSADVLFYVDLCAELTKYIPTPWCFVPAESAQQRLPDPGPMKAIQVELQLMKDRV